MNTSFSGVVIGVDGSPGSWAAIRAGVEDAQRLDLTVRLVHVVPDYLPMAPMVPLPSAGLLDTGTEILALAAEEAVERGPDLAIDVELRHGARAVQLAESAVGATALYVGTDDRRAIDRLFRGNTSSGVAARATCPVVVVPADSTDALHGVVVAGMKTPKHSAELLGAAFASAATRGARLVVLHAWKLPSGYDDIVASRVTVEEWAKTSTTEMEELLKDWRASYPDVEVDVRIAHSDAARALVSASAEADLLVVVGRAHGVPAAVHLGAVARSVLRSSYCPVLVVPPDGVTAAPGLVLERAGALEA